MAEEILIVDDEADIRLAITGILEDEGYLTRAVGNSDQALAEVDRARPNLVILDIWLQNSALDGIQLLKRINRACSIFSSVVSCALRNFTRLF